MTTIRISIDEDIERTLTALKRDYPTLDYPELFKLGLSELYRQRERETHQAWLESLPELELSEAEQRELGEALDEADEVIKRGEAKSMSVDELMRNLEDGVLADS